MKKSLKLVVLSVLFSALALTSQAQATLAKSDKFVEGTFSYSSSTGTDAAYGIKPTVGYFLTDKFAVGVLGEVGKTSTGAKTLNYGAFGRCYCLNVGEKFKAYSQLTVLSSSTDNAGTKTNSFSTDLGIGANYFFTSKLALSVNLVNLISYTSSGSNSNFTVGFDGVTNPISPVKFGVLYKF